MAEEILTVGCDPELMLVDAIGMPVSAIGLIPGSKEAPALISSGTCHPDNVMAEFNANPAGDADSFSASVQSCLTDLRTMLDSHGCTISERQTSMFMQSDLEHPDAREAGCNPDNDAYSGGATKDPPVLQHTSLRCAGGHVHIGYPIEDKLKFIQCCDLYLTIPSLAHECSMRRSLYGQAGSFRDKPYGVEYRSLGNHWIWTDARRKWVWRQIELITQNYQSLQLPENLAEIINNHDLESAELLCQRYGLIAYPQ